MTSSSGRFGIVPVTIGAVVLLISFSLLAIIARSPYTHANLTASFDPGYTRTDQSFVGAPVPFTGSALAGPTAGDLVEHGKQLYIANGCADCHGLEGHGGIIGPSITGTKASKLRARMQVGPQGMPAYAPDALTDNDFAAIAAYLNGRSK